MEMALSGSHIIKRNADRLSLFTLLDTYIDARPKLSTLISLICLPADKSFIISFTLLSNSIAKFVKTAH